MFLLGLARAGQCHCPFLNSIVSYDVDFVGIEVPDVSCFF